MNKIELLLGLDNEVLQKVPQEELEIKRLSKLIGQPFTVTVKAISGRQAERIRELSTDKKGNQRGYESNLLVCMYGIIDPDMKNADLQKKFGASTPKDLIDKMFNMGEVTKIANKIGELSGLDDDDLEEEIKN